jgi:DNA-binding protein
MRNLERPPYQGPATHRPRIEDDSTRLESDLLPNEFRISAGGYFKSYCARILDTLEQGY